MAESMLDRPFENSWLDCDTSVVDENDLMEWLLEGPYDPNKIQGLAGDLAALKNRIAYRKKEADRIRGLARRDEDRVKWIKSVVLRYMVRRNTKKASGTFNNFTRVTPKRGKVNADPNRTPPEFSKVVIIPQLTEIGQELDKAQKEGRTIDWAWYDPPRDYIKVQ